jgi:hypothetical protein
MAGFQNDGVGRHFFCRDIFGRRSKTEQRRGTSDPIQHNAQAWPLAFTASGAGTLIAIVRITSLDVFIP